MASVRCHYVPQFYLNYFLHSNSNLLWVYDKKNISVRRQAPSSTAVIGDYYLSSKDKYGFKDKTVEVSLSEMESSAKPILDEWVNHPSQWKQTDKPIIAMFLAFAHCRVPRSVAVMKEITMAGVNYALDSMKELSEVPDEVKRVKRDYENYCKVKGKAVNMALEEYADMMSNAKRKFLIQANEKPALGQSFSLAKEIYAQLLEMNWCICVAKKNHFFVTSDSPLNVFAPKGRGKVIFGGGFALPNVEIAFPLSPKACLLLSHKSSGQFTYVYSDFIDEINNRTARMAERFVISSYRSNKIGRMVAEHAQYSKMPKIDPSIVKRSIKKCEVESLNRL